VGVQRFVILGGGMVAGYVARELAARGLERGQLTIVSEDTFLPYERPPLSKGLLAGREHANDILINDDGFYRERGIDVMLNTRVVRVDFDEHCLHLERGEPLVYEHLLIATGARPRMLDLPGADLDGVRYLRTIDDSRAIRDAAANAKRAVAIGGGFIAMEVASVLASQGVDVSMVFPDDRVWKKLFTPEMSSFFETYYRDRGVRLEASQMVTAIEGDGGRVVAVSTSTGNRIETDLVVAGIGIEPNLALFEGTALKMNGGIAVNEYLETSIPGVLAAGDVVRYRDLLFGKMRRADHWDNAVEQGKHAAAILCGERTPFVHVPYFFSDVFDLSYEFWGDASDATSVIYRGDVASGAFSAWWQRRETVVAAFVMNRPDEERELAPQWISERQDVSQDALRTASNLQDIPLR
jgi:NADPH-dependent 2,4-dienoyl-CoA reductase/sulfur reductase-like enzyme